MNLVFSLAQLMRTLGNSRNDPPSLYGLEYLRIRQLVDRAPAEAWPQIVAFIHGNSDHLEAVALIEEFIDLHRVEFVGAIAESASADLRVAAVLADVHLGDMIGPEVDQIEDLQEAFRAQAP